MKLQTKLLFYYLPITLFSLTILGLWSSSNVARTQKNAVLQHMNIALDTYISQTVKPHLHFLLKNQFYNIPSFTTRYQEEATARLNSITLPWNGHIMILSDGKEIYRSPGNTTEFSKTEWQKTLDTLENRPGNFHSGTVRTRGGNCYFVGTYLPEWDWSLVAVTPESTVSRANRSIKHITLLMVAGCTAVLVFASFFLFNHILTRPIQQIQKLLAALPASNTVQSVKTKNDELGLLTSHLVDIAGTVIQNRQDLESWNSRLEEEVQTRTRELQQANERFDLAMQGAEDGLWDWNLKTDDIYYSPRWKSMIGYDDGELENSYGTWEKLVHPADKADIESAIKNYLEQPGDKGFRVEFRMRHKKGHYIDILSRGFCVKDPLSERNIRFIGTHVDITERKKIQKEKEQFQAHLLNEQKMVSVGQLAAGIAHEINTPIQYLDTNIQFLKEAFQDINGLQQDIEKFTKLAKEQDLLQKEIEALQNRLEEVDWEYLSEEIPVAIDQSKEGISRVRSIVLAMKNFSHPGAKVKELVDINELIETTVTVSRNEWKYVSDIHFELEKKSPQVICLRNEMSQVLLNIIVNAAYAIEEKLKGEVGAKGTITIKSRSRQGSVEIKMSDTGTGIPKAIIDKIYDPFFTTKEVGKGTGQGLAIAYDIITNKHAGTLSVTSKEGQGTTFTIVLKT